MKLMLAILAVCSLPVLANWTPGQLARTQAPVAGGSPSTLTNELMAYWTLDETSGNRADSWSTNTLVQSQTVTGTNGVISGSAHMVSNSPPNVLSIADNESVSVDGRSWTMTGWFYNEGQGGVVRYIVCKRNSTSSREFATWLATDNKFTFVVYTNNTGTHPNLVVNSALSQDTWYFLTVGFDHPNLTQFAAINAANWTTNTWTQPITNSTASLTFGRLNGANNNYFGGRLDEFGLYHRVLTTSEVNELYNSGSGARPPFP